MSSPTPWTEWFNAEARLLGALLTWSEDQPRAFDVVADVLSADDFSRPQFAQVYTALSAAAEDGERLGPVPVLHRLENRTMGAVMLGELLQPTPRPSEATLLELARAIRREARLRQAKSLGVSIAKRAAAGDVGADELLMEAQDEMARIAMRQWEPEDEAPVASIRRASASLREQLQGRHPDRLKTGLVDLDKRFSTGLRPRTLTVLAALTSRGKSSLAVQIGDFVAASIEGAKERSSVLLFSLEMGADEINARRLHFESGVTPAVVEGFDQRHGDEDRLIREAEARLARRPMRIEYGANMTIAQIRAKARRQLLRHGLKLVIVDYLQLAEPTAPQETREREVSAVARGLKAMAMELEVPVLALAQLNREVEKRPTDRPRLSDLRESGAIEQHSDNVLFIHHLQKDPANVLSITVAKQRNGPRDVWCRVLFRGDLFMFESYTGAQP